MYKEALNDFEPVQLIQGNVMVEWNWVGQGLSGGYQEEDPGDIPMLSFTICSCPCLDTSCRHWEPIPNASYGTQIPLDTPRAVLKRLAQKIMDRVYDEIQAGHPITNLCQDLSHIRNEGCPQCGSEEGYTGRSLEYHLARFDHKGNWVEDLGCDDSGPGGGPYTCCACGAEFEALPGRYPIDEKEGNPMNTAEISDRYSRQRDIVPPERLASCKATVVGVGAVGRQVALQLAAMGLPWMQIIDFDHVEESNLASQGYLEDDLGRAKVDATAALCRQINHRLDIFPVNDRFRRSREMGNILFNAVDSIETRGLLWEAVQNRVDLLVDGRMSAEVLRVLTAADPSSREYYPSTLFTAEQAFVGACTAKTTIYCANIAAGFMIAQFTKWLRNLPIDPDIQVNLLSMEMNILKEGDDYGRTG